MDNSSYVAVLIKMFFLLTPFFALSMFLTATADYAPERKRRIAVRTTLSVLLISLIIYWFGEYLFMVLGITVDAFRIGAGTILMLTAINLVNASSHSGRRSDGDDALDISVVPLAVPCIVGPGTIGALLVMGADGGTLRERIVICLGIATAVGIIGVFLYLSDQLERMLKRNGIQILSKITGLMLAALAAQIIFTGIKNILF